VVSITTRPRFTLGERTPGTHWIGGWVGPRAGLDAGARRKIKRHKLFEILQEKYIPNLLLQNITEIYKDNEILIKLNNTTTDTKSIKQRSKIGLYFIPNVV
jgi:hypothetical protein